MKFTAFLEDKKIIWQWPGCRLELEAGEFHERVQKAYERLVRDNRRRFVVVDAARGVDEVARDALDAVLERLLPDRRA